MPLENAQNDIELPAMLKRKTGTDIMHWIETSEKALLIYGVRLIVTKG